MALDLRQLEWRVLELEKYGGSGGLTKAMADTLYLPIGWTPTPDLKSFKWNGDWGGTTYPEVGSTMTWSVSDPNPSGASLAGIEGSVFHLGANHGEATVEGNKVYFTKSGWVNFQMLAPNGAGFTQSLWIAPAGQGNTATRPPVQQAAPSPDIHNEPDIGFTSLPKEEGVYSLKVDANGSITWIKQPK